MYLRELLLKNSGPLRDLHLEFAFTADGLPIPHLVVGRNGSGKTNLLSLVADALMEGAADVYTDVLTRLGIGRNWFRIVGGKTTSYHEPGSFSVLRFEHDGQPLYYCEHAGQFTMEQAKAILPPTLVDGANWPDAEPHGKTFKIDEKDVRTIYQGGAHIFFPSSRSEYPFWLNQASIVEDNFDTTENFSQSLSRPIFVERGVDQFAQWIMGVLSESKIGVEQVVDLNNPNQFLLKPMGNDLTIMWLTSKILQAANDVIKAIVNDSEAQFFWTGRRQARKVGVISGNNVIAAGLDALSGGQSTLLAIFGTILRYADAANLEPQDVQGIVLIDELDAHMHIDLQAKAVPRLVAMFPRVQFLISSHSPFLALGMEKQFSAETLRIIELPSGQTLSAETFTEFDCAMKALAETRAFESRVGEALVGSEKPLIWVAGETDVPYLKTAATLLGYPELAECVEWIGTPSRAGGSEYAGDGNLKAALKFLRANKGFTNRTIIAIFDCDAKQMNERFGNVHVINFDQVSDSAVENGIENLLPQRVFTADVFKEDSKPSGIAGKPNVIYQLRKKYLADKLCGDNADVSNFEKFEPYLHRISEILNGQTRR